MHAGIWLLGNCEKLRRPNPTCTSGKVLSRWLEDRSVIGHAMRAMALIRVVRALALGGKAALTHLGEIVLEART